MNKYLIPLVVTAGIGIYYFCNNRKNNNSIKTLELKGPKKNKINKDIIELDTIDELKEINEIKEIKDKSKYQIVVYKKPGDWEIVDKI